MPTRSRSSSLAFTQLELLAVIAIIAILAAIIIPVVGSVRARASATKCISNLRQIGMVAGAWSNDNRGRIVPVFYPGDPNNAGSLRNWTGLLAPYMGRTSTAAFLTANEMEVYVCSLRPDRFGYAYNYQYLSWVQEDVNRYQWATVREIGNPAQTVLMADSKNELTTVENFASWRAYLRAPNLAAGVKDSISAFDHSGKANVLWVDGHVSSETSSSAYARNDQLWDKN